jgi:hypothetical protein
MGHVRGALDETQAGSIQLGHRCAYQQMQSDLIGAQDVVTPSSHYIVCRCQFPSVFPRQFAARSDAISSQGVWPMTIFLNFKIQHSILWIRRSVDTPVRDWTGPRLADGNGHLTGQAPYTGESFDSSGRLLNVMQNIVLYV